MYYACQVSSREASCAVTDLVRPTSARHFTHRHNRIQGIVSNDLQNPDMVPALYMYRAPKSPGEDSVLVKWNPGTVQSSTKHAQAQISLSTPTQKYADSDLRATGAQRPLPPLLRVQCMDCQTSFLSCAYLSKVSLAAGEKGWGRRLVCRARPGGSIWCPVSCPSYV